MQSIKNNIKIKKQIIRLVHMRENLEKHISNVPSGSLISSISVVNQNNIATVIKANYDNKDKFIIDKGIKSMIEEIDNCINSYQEELKTYLKNSNMKQTKFGSVFNLLYTPRGIPESLKKQLQTETPVMSSLNEETQLYDAEDLVEDYKEDPSSYNKKEEREFLQFLLENDIDYIEI